ncbi:hypothetical protein OC842_001445, partial [Tilletia horrida]
MSTGATLVRAPAPKGGRALALTAPQTPSRPSANPSKRTADQALTATPIPRKKVLGSLAARIGMSPEDVDQMMEDIELEVLREESPNNWADIIGNEEAEARAAGIHTDSSDSESEAEETSASAEHTVDTNPNAAGSADDWTTAQSRGQRRQSQRVKAIAATAAASAGEKGRATAAQQQTTRSAATQRTSATTTAQGKETDSAGAPAGLSTTPAEAIAAMAAALDTADRQQQERTRARTKAYAFLMGQMEKMCADGHMDTEELNLMLAASKAAHRHAEAQGFAPGFPKTLIEALRSYDVKQPERAVRILAQNASVTPAYGQAAARAKNGPPPMLQQYQHVAPRDPFAHLKDKHILGQGR